MALENLVELGQHVTLMTMLVGFVIILHAVILEELLSLVDQKMSGVTKRVLQVTITVVLIADCSLIIFHSVSNVVDHLNTMTAGIFRVA